MKSSAIEMTREELYRQVWTTPIRTLAAMYGVSDVGLAKVCQRYDIPKPAKGHWAKKQFGKEPEQPPLPVIRNPDLATVRFFAGHSRNPNKGPADDSTKPLVEGFFDADLHRLAVEELARDDTITVPAALRSPHPLVVRTKEALIASSKQHSYHSDPILRPCRDDDLPCLSICVSRRFVERALRIVDTVLKALQVRGYSLLVPKGRWETIYVEALGEKFKLCVWEPLERKEHQPNQEEKKRLEKYPGTHSVPKWDRAPSGRIQLEISRDTTLSPPCTIRDGKKQKVEDKLHRIPLAILRSVDNARRLKAEWAEDERKRAEAKRQQQAAEEKRLQEEERRRQEQVRVDSLIAHCERWHQAGRLRGFLQFMRDKAIERHGDIEDESDFARWLSWAEDVAQQLDPLERVMALKTTATTEPATVAKPR